MAETAHGAGVYHNFGNVNAVTYDLTSVTDGDTLATGFNRIHNVILSCVTVGTPISFGWSASGGTVTLDVSSNGKAFKATVLGD